MTEALSRAFVADIEIRAGSDGTGRTISGVIVPYGKIAMVSDGGRPYREAFQQGAFDAAIHNMGGNFGRVKLLSQHNSRSNPLGMATNLWSDPAGLMGDFKVSKTRAGDEAIELVRDGAIDSFSVGFSPQKHSVREGVTWRTQTGIREASLVTFPSYADALVSGVRDEWDGLTDEMREQAMAWLRDQNSPAVELVPGLSDEGAPVDEAAAVPLRSIPQQRLAYRLALIERGIKHEQED